MQKLCWCCLRGMAPTIVAPVCFGPGGCPADARLIALPATPDAGSGGHWQLGQQRKATRLRRLAATASFGATKAARSPDGPDLNESAAGAANAVVAGGSERKEGQSAVRAAHYGTANGLAATASESGDGRRRRPQQEVRLLGRRSQARVCADSTTLLPRLPWLAGRGGAGKEGPARLFL